MSSQFPNLLRSSRLASLHRSALAEDSAEAIDLARNKWYPTHQLVATKTSAFHRRNWGLKSQIPKKHSSLYLNVKALDSEVGLAQFDGNTGFYRKLQKFRELQFPLELPKMAANSNYFKAHTVRNKGVDSLSKSQIRELNLTSSEVRRKFREYLTNEKNVPVEEFRKTNADARDVISGFLGHKGKDQSTSSASHYQFKPALGLSYKLKGSLMTTPEGVRSAKVVPGRTLGAGKGIVGIGGFVASGALSTGMGDRIKRHEFIINKATMDERGRVSLSALAADTMRPSSRSSSMLDMQSLFRDPPRKNRFSSI